MLKGLLRTPKLYLKYVVHCQLKRHHLGNKYQNKIQSHSVLDGQVLIT